MLGECVQLILLLPPCIHVHRFSLITIIIITIIIIVIITIDCPYYKFLLTLPPPSLYANFRRSLHPVENVGGMGASCLL